MILSTKYYSIDMFEQLVLIMRVRMEVTMSTEDVSNLFNADAVRLEQTPVWESTDLSPKSFLRRKGDDEWGIFKPETLYLKTLGGELLFSFSTYEITAHKIYVVCADFSRYPFRIGSTLIEGVLNVQIPGNSALAFCRFLCKIDAVFSEEQASLVHYPAGFLVRIVQQSYKEKLVLEAFVSETGGKIS